MELPHLGIAQLARGHAGEGEGQQQQRPPGACVLYRVVDAASRICMPLPNRAVLASQEPG
jgi:hypothetical protein